MQPLRKFAQTISLKRFHLIKETIVAMGTRTVVFLECYQNINYLPLLTGSLPQPQVVSVSRDLCEDVKYGMWVLRWVLGDDKQMCCNHSKATEFCSHSYHHPLCRVE